MIDIRKEIEILVNENFQIEFDTEEFPMSKYELIDLLTEKFQQLNEQLKREQLLETFKNRYQTYRLN